MNELFSKTTATYAHNFENFVYFMQNEAKTKSSTLLNFEETTVGQRHYTGKMIYFCIQNTEILLQSI